MIKTRPNGQPPFVDTFQKAIDDIEEAMMPVARHFLGDERVEEIIDSFIGDKIPVDIHYFEIEDD